MNKYTRRFMVILTAGSAIMSALADVSYEIPRLDVVRIAQEKKHYDQKYTRIQYAWYGSYAALAAAVAYYGYTKWTAPASTQLPTPVIPEVATVSAVTNTLVSDHDRLAQQEKIIESLNQRLNTLEGISWLNWGSRLMKHAIHSMSLETVCRFIAIPVAGHMMTSFFAIDAFWYEFRAETDFTQGIIAKAKRFAMYGELNRTIDEEKKLAQEASDRALYSIRDSITLLVKQLEKIIGFMRHKQELYREKNPDIADRMDREVLYLMVVYNDFAQHISECLHAAGMTRQERADSIIEITQQFFNEYTMLKEHLKTLDEEPDSSVDGV